MSEYNPEPRDMRGTGAHDKLREYYKDAPPVKKKRANPSDNIMKAIRERNERWSAELDERARRGYELHKQGMAIDEIAEIVGLSAKKLRVRWAKLESL